MCDLRISLALLPSRAQCHLSVRAVFEIVRPDGSRPIERRELLNWCLADLAVVLVSAEVYYEAWTFVFLASLIMLGIVTWAAIRVIFDEARE